MFYGHICAHGKINELRNLQMYNEVKWKMKHPPDMKVVQMCYQLDHGGAPLCAQKVFNMPM